MHSRPMYFRPEGFNVKERKKQDLESFVEVFILFIIIKSVKILRWSHSYILQQLDVIPQNLVYFCLLKTFEKKLIFLF